MRGSFIILYGTTPSTAQLLKLYIYQVIDNIRFLTFYHDNQVSPLNPFITVVCRKVHFCKKTRGKRAWCRITENEPNWLNYTHIISFTMFYKKYAVTGLFLKSMPPPWLSAVYTTSSCSILLLSPTRPSFSLCDTNTQSFCWP